MSITRDEIADFLSRVNGFSSIDPRELLQIAEGVEVREYPAGSNIIRKGDAGDHMHVLYDGRVRVLLTDNTGKSKMVVHLGPRISWARWRCSPATSATRTWSPRSR